MEQTTTDNFKFSMGLCPSGALLLSRFCTVVGTIERRLNVGTFSVRSAGSLLCALRIILNHTYSKKMP